MSSINNLVVVIFTYRSPFGSVPEFVEDEIPFWNKAKKVIIISLAEHHESHISIGANAEAFAICPTQSLFSKALYVIMGLRHADIFRELLHILLPKSSGFIQRLVSFATHTQATERYFQGARRILAKQVLGSSDTLVMYSYWCGSATHAAIKLKKKIDNDHPIVITRVHRGDLYEYANQANYLPLHNQILASCDHIYPISEDGVDYVINHWNCHSDQVELARLGIPDHFSGRYPVLNEWFQIVSCSYINPVKRVHLIAEALSDIDQANIYWTHIGGGPGLENIRRLCARILRGKSNVRYDLLGDLEHSKVIEMFRVQNINLLVNVSSSEGIPVSMMEAHCSGIPTLGASVGGVKEIINHGVNGRLMPSDFSVEDLKTEILLIVNMKIDEYSEMCINARNSWLKRYSSKNNYTKFVDSVYQLCLKNPFKP